MATNMSVYNPNMSSNLGNGGYYIPPVNNKPAVYKAPSSSGQVLGASTVRTSTTNTPSNNNGLPSAINAVQQQGDNGNAQIEADYNAAMDALNNQESSLQSQAGSASSQIDTQAGDVRNQLTNSQTQQVQGVNSTLQQGETQGKTAMQQARDLYKQTQQQNIAQLSALGISSSSVQEALAEKLGVETARRIAGVTDSVDQIRTNASNELNRIKQYYTGQLDTLSKNVENQKAQIQQALVQGLNQINSARNQAASAKANARANLLSQVQSQIGQLTQQQQQFQQSLDAWAQQKAAALTPIAQDPNYIQNIIAQTQNLNQQFAPTGFVATPSFNVNQNGTYTGQINFQKPPKDNQDLTNPFATQ